MLAALGVGTLLAALNVAYRDFRYVIPFLVQVWMFATPSVYMQLADEPPAVAGRPAPAPAASTGPPRPEDPGPGRRPGSPLVHAALALNPMTGLIGAFRASALGGPIPWGNVLISAACSMAVFIGGCLYFRRVEDSFADVI